jgi:DNA-binding NtrC family response regulator
MAEVVQTPSSPPHTSSALVHTRRERPHVFLAEDDHDLRPLFLAGLLRAGHQVTAASDGREILAFLSAASRGLLARPDVVVMDVRMPHLTGLEVLQFLADMAYGVPVVLITGFGDVTTRARAYALGAIEILDKPVSCARIVAAIEGALASGGR